MLFLRLLLWLLFTLLHFCLLLRRPRPDEEVQSHQRRDGRWVRSYRRRR